MDQSFLGWMPRAGGAIASDVMGLPGQFAWMRDPVTGKLVRRYEVEGWMPEYSGFESAEAARRESRGKQYEAAVAKEKEAKAMAQAPTPTPTVAQPSAGSFRPYADPRMIADKNKAQIQADIAAGKYDRPAPVAPAAPVAQRTAPVGIGSLYTPPQDFSAEYEKMMRPEVSAQEAMAKYQGLLGEDASRAAMKERINKMEARAAKEEAQAPWLALAEAGLGMAAGKSQFALQNIAEGGKQGIKSFVDAKDRMVKAEERRFDMASRVAQAERAEQVAAATYGLQSEERAKAHNDVVQQNKLKYKADLASDNAKNEFNAKKFKLEYAQKDREIDLMDKRIDKQIASAENTSLRYELQNKRDSLKTALNEINDMLKNEQASLNPDPAKIAGLQRKFDAAYNALYSLAIQGSGSQPTGNRPPLGSFNLK